MKVIVSEHVGFCFGVERAVKKAERMLDNRGLSNYSVGPLIHNPQTIEKLTEKGLRIVNRIEQIKNGRLIIRAHGLRPELLSKARAKNIEVVDSTCPFVKKVQEASCRLVKQGYAVIIAGDKNHPEVKSIGGFTDEKAMVAAGPSDLDKLNLNKSRKIALLAQTTQSNSNFQAIINKLVSKGHFEELRIFNTICRATVVRQREARSIAQKVEMMIIMGGRLSANTKRLAGICKEAGVETHHVEAAKDIKPSWFRKKRSIGLAGGTSTPAWVIKQAADRLKKVYTDDHRRGKLTAHSL
ncbi:MAG: 4-hydroxy-3-methylbut-2-enyl diphosphate reductase [Candidatus Omnitrophota bacterium]|nr:4-hydroxy-3-methylbut-2-enyl diphosphate reductase [Candidatus Omnitrophota bacterium]